MANLLIVESDRITLRLLTLMLIKDNHQVTAVHNSERILAHLTENPVEVILLGIETPHEDGIKLLEGFSVCDKYKEIPVIVYTSSGQDDLVEQSINLGASAVLTQPFSSWELRKSVAESLNEFWTDYCVYAEEDCDCMMDQDPYTCMLKKLSISQDALQARNLS